MYWSLHTNKTAYISTNRGYGYVKGDEEGGVVVRVGPSSNWHHANVQ